LGLLVASWPAPVRLAMGINARSVRPKARRMT
jgi:hypothetical protein